MLYNMFSKCTEHQPKLTQTLKLRCSKKATADKAGHWAKSSGLRTQGAEKSVKR
jgi:hypothetical protein